MKTIILALGVAAVFTVSVRGQSFLNLNFESAQNLPANPPIPDGTDVAVANALPDWTAYDGPFALPDINYVSNTFSGYSTVVELEGGSLALSGDFSVGLYDGGSIGQTGLIPDDAESLEFEASFPANLYLTLGGQNLYFSQLSGGPNYDVYGVDIPAGMAGQDEPLTFYLNGPGGTLLDNIQFSTSSIPEPGECGLIGVWAVLFGVFRRRKRRGLSANFAN